MLKIEWIKKRIILSRRKIKAHIIWLISLVNYNLKMCKKNHRSKQWNQCRFNKVKTVSTTNSIIQGDFKVSVRIIFKTPGITDNVHQLGKNWYWLHAPSLFSTQGKIHELAVLKRRKLRAWCPIVYTQNSWM